MGDAFEVHAQVVHEDEPQQARRVVAAFGGRFAVADKVGLMPLLRFAHVARKGIDSADVEGLDAMYQLLRQVIADDEWDRFEEAATTARAGDEEILAVVKDAMAVISARPTGRPSASSGGPQTVSTSSPADSSSPVIDRLVERGRPDLALVVSQAQEQRSRASA